MLREIMRMLDSALWSTSANASCSAPPASIDEIAMDVLASVDAIVDIGKLPQPSPSTIVDLSTNKIIILREGPIKAKDIASITAITIAGYDAYS
jgi:tRNA A37 threonylcarbamoyladenosine synthetase subunit TsaC/SUA5/YrdC